MPARFDVSKRYAYHQSPSHDTDKCFGLRHAIQNLIDNKVIALPTRPSINNNPLPNHNFVISQECIDPFGNLIKLISQVN